MLTYIYSLFHTVRAGFFKPWSLACCAHSRSSMREPNHSISGDTKSPPTSLPLTVSVKHLSFYSHFFRNHNSQLFSFKKPTSSNLL